MTNWVDTPFEDISDFLRYASAYGLEPQEVEHPHYVAYQIRTKEGRYLVAQARSGGPVRQLHQGRDPRPPAPPLEERLIAPRSAYAGPWRYLPESDDGRGLGEPILEGHLRVFRSKGGALHEFVVRSDGACYARVILPAVLGA